MIPPTFIEKVEFADEERILQLVKSPHIKTETKAVLRKYLKNNRVGVNQFRVEYYYPDDVRIGRLYARNGLGLQSFPKDVRAYIASSLYKDFDIVMCLPSITAFMFREKGIDETTIQKYLQNRSQILEQKNLTKEEAHSYLCNAPITPQDSFFQDIHSKIYKTLVPALKIQFPDLWKRVLKLKQKDGKCPESSFFTRVVQMYEGKALLAMNEFFEQRGVRPDVLIFDGILVKLKDSDPASEFLADLQKHVLMKAQLDLTVKVKPLQPSADFVEKVNTVLTQLNLKNSKNDETENDDDSDDSDDGKDVTDDGVTYSNDVARSLFPKSAELLNYLNRHFAKVTDSETVWYCFRRRTTDAWIWRGKATTAQAVSHLGFTKRVGKKWLSVGVFDWWSKQYDITTFKNLVMDPSHVGDIAGEAVNLFRGFKAKLVPEVDLKLIEPIMYHIKEVINSGNEEHADYTKKWFASILQKPEVKNGTAMVNFSEEHGTGKNTLFEFFGEKVIGREHYLYVKSVNDIIGQFTSLHACKIFVVADEVLFAGDHKANRELKSLITQAWQKLEKKGHDPLMIDNYLNLVFLSQNKDAIRIEDTDRRYFVKEASDIHRGDQGYFNRLYASLTQEAADHFYTYLMNLDLSNFDVRQIPETKEKVEMRRLTMTPIDLFVSELLEGSLRRSWSAKKVDDNESDDENDDEDSRYFEPGIQYSYTMDQLFMDYINFCSSGKAGRVAHQLSKQSFSQTIRNKVNIDNQTKNRTGGLKIFITVEPAVKSKKRPVTTVAEVEVAPVEAPPAKRLKVISRAVFKSMKVTRKDDGEDEE